MGSLLTIVDLVLPYVPRVVHDAAWVQRFLAWRKERDERVKAGGSPTLPPAAMILLASLFLSGCKTVGPLIQDVDQYCRERPWECGNGTPPPVTTPTATPTIAPPCPPGTGLDFSRSTSAVPCVPLPTATPTAIATPTTAPTLQPTPSATPTAAPTFPPPEPCNAAPPAPPEPVSVLFVGRCPKGFEQVDGYDATARFAPPGTVICAARSTCMLDGHGACPGVGDRASWAFGYNLNQGQVIADFNGKFLIYDAERGCKDAYGRFFHERQDCQVLYTNPTDPNAYWSYTAMAPAATCTPQPTATPTPGGPTPVPPAIPQPADFRASIVAACQELHYTEVDGGSWKGKCDSTIRYAGTLRSGEFIRSTCDRDHWACAVDPGSCPGITPEGMAAHEKVFELCGGNEWWTPSGTEFHVSGAQRFEVDRRNNYQVWVWGAPDDHGIHLYACLPRGAKRDDGVPIPVDGAACGGDHPVTFEAPR